MMDLLANRSPREKVLVVGLATLCVMWFVVTQIWQPLQAMRHDIAARIPRIERALAEVQANPIPLAVATTPDPRTMPAVLTEAAAAFGVTISRLQPQGAQVQVTLEDAPFDTVLLWTQSLLQDDGLRLIALTLTRRSGQGIVSTTMTVER